MNANEDYDYIDIWGQEPERTPEEEERQRQINEELGLTDDIEL